MTGYVSADGSPLAMYLALPADETALHIRDWGGQGSSVLELGSGPGRTTRVLIALGHKITAVDDSEEMLNHVTGATTVQADITALALNKRFDVVLAASHLINHADPAHRHALLQVCRNHVKDAGVVLLQRYPPGWLAEAETKEVQRGAVTIRFVPGEQRAAGRAGSVVYMLGEQQWVQEFVSADIGDELIAQEAAAAGLIVDTGLTDDPGWVALRPG